MTEEVIPSCYWNGAWYEWHSTTQEWEQTEDYETITSDTDADSGSDAD